jgi:hypothetical protein
VLLLLLLLLLRPHCVARLNPVMQTPAAAAPPTSLFV